MAGRSGKAHLSLGRLSHDELLDRRFCDLGVTLEDTSLGRRVDRLYMELERRGIVLRPHVWLSSEWFSPDGVPGIAAPFYLAHPRLVRLERRMMLEVEGGTAHQCMQLLRHEAGHALSTAYRLHYKKKWRKVFGNAGKPYPQHYRPKPFSRRFVLHLDWWYAQAHPSEDFAETFAIWLLPREKWRAQYEGWPALKKLEYVDELMADIAGERPAVRTRKRVDSLRQLRSTLRQHYGRKQRRYAQESADFYARDLRRVFPEPKASDGRTESAARFLRRVAPEIRDAVCAWTGTHQYSIDKVLRDMIERCRDLKLRRAKDEQETKTNAMLMVAVQTMNYLHDGHHTIAL